jgi:hypothetical protein
MIYQPPLSSDGGRIMFYRYFPRLKPSIGIGVTKPFVRLDHFYSSTPDSISKLASPGTSVILYMLSGDASIRRGINQFNLDARSAALVSSLAIDPVSVTTPNRSAKSEGILIEFYDHAKITTLDTMLVNASDVPSYETEETRETRIAGKWGGIETNGFLSISLLDYLTYSSLRVLQSGHSIMILVLEGWISSGHENIVKDQIYIPDETVNIDCHRGARLLVLSSGDNTVT